jgi:hypothetical protein
MRSIVAVAALAAALAGCADPPQLTGAHLATAIGEASSPDCPVQEQRAATANASERAEVVRGCMLLRDPGISERFGRADVVVVVPAGVRVLVAQFHLHGAEPLRATLADDSGIVERAEAKGDTTRDSFVRFEMPLPREGTWELRASTEARTFARAWTASFVLRS